MIDIDKYLTFSNNRLYIASNQTIKVGFLQLTEDKAGSKLEVNSVLQINIELGKSKVYGLLVNRKYTKKTDAHGHDVYEESDKVIVILETSDQQLDFNYIKIANQSSLNHDSQSNYSYSLV